MLPKASNGRAFQVAFSSATIVAACNQMQPVRMYALFGAQQRFSDCVLCEKILSFCSEVAARIFVEN